MQSKPTKECRFQILVSPGEGKYYEPLDDKYYSSEEANRAMAEAWQNQGWDQDYRYRKIDVLEEMSIKAMNLRHAVREVAQWARYADNAFSSDLGYDAVQMGVEHLEHARELLNKILKHFDK